MDAKHKMTPSATSNIEDSGFASNAIGIAAILLSHFAFNLDWISSALLFLPVKGMVLRLKANDGLGIVQCATLILLYPVIAGISSAIAAKAMTLPCLRGPNASSPLALPLINGTITAIILLVVFAIYASVVGYIFWPFAMPAKMHKIVVYAIEVFARLLVLIYCVAFVRYFDGMFVNIPTVAKIIFAVVLAAGTVLSIWRLWNRGGNTTGPCTAENPGKGSDAERRIRVEKRPNVKFSDVIGMDDAKEQIRLRLVEPLRNPKKAKRYGLSVGGGVLLYGPPGTGKTMLARALAGELNLPFFMITSSDVFGKYVGESARNMRAIFAEIRKTPFSVVFIDELETLFPSRAQDVHESTRKVISVLLQELDGLDKTKNPILLLGATNVPWMVDEAFLRPGRFDIKIFVGLPDEPAREKLLEAAFSKGSIPVEDGLVRFMAKQTPNYSGADINGVMDRLRQLAYVSGAAMYTRDLAEKAIDFVSPTANGEMLDRIQEWESKTMAANSHNSGSNGVKIAVRPDVTLADVAGMENVKEEIRLRLIEPVCNSTLANHYGLRAGGGLLLYGPPGTGKTFIARAVAGEMKLPFYSISSADIFGRYVGESEQNLRKIFRDIRKNDLSVVFIDELENLFPRRTSDVHEVTRSIISLLLQELDGIDGERNPILLIGATNVPWMVDEAFLRPGRFDVCLYIGLPDFEARRYLVYRALDNGEVLYETGLDTYIAKRTEGFSGADLNGFFNKMRQDAFKRHLPHYTCAQADELLRTFEPSNSNDIIERIKQWEAARRA